MGFFRVNDLCALQATHQESEKMCGSKPLHDRFILIHLFDMRYLEWMPWSEWSVCSQTCGAGTQQRHRKCPSSDCVGKDVDQRPCEDVEPCETWSEWTSWSTCRGHFLHLLNL